jgi:hypothetical protein
MAYLHCENCDWQQDDFWSENGWNPFTDSSIDYFRDVLCRGLKGEKIKLDVWLVEERGIEHEVIDGIAHVDFKEMLVWELDRIKRKILNMTWYTEAEFRGDPNPVCPQCGSSEDFDID